ncbi:hypothetical protein GS531_22935 [Rhodococcus hoagii]|nr:hypothetical protein [Prescottella equi]
MGAEDRNGLYLGDGKVLTGGEVRPVADVAHFTGDGQGIFRLDDGAPAPAPAGDSAAPAPPVTLRLRPRRPPVTLRRPLVTLRPGAQR